MPRRPHGLPLPAGSRCPEVTWHERGEDGARRRQCAAQGWAHGGLGLRAAAAGLVKLGCGGGWLCNTAGWARPPGTAQARCFPAPPPPAPAAGHRARSARRRGAHGRSERGAAHGEQQGRAGGAGSGGVVRREKPGESRSPPPMRRYRPRAGPSRGVLLGPARPRSVRGSRRARGAQLGPGCPDGPAAALRSPPGARHRFPAQHELCPDGISHPVP